MISSDRRNPTVNAYGPLFGSPEYATDDMPILDPKTSKVTFFKMPVRDPKMPEVARLRLTALKPMQPSAYWGDEKIWDTKANNHNAMFDGKGRVWLAATVTRQRTIRTFAKRARTIRRPRCSRSNSQPPAGGDTRPEDDEIHLRRHLLRHSSPAVRL